MYDDDVRLEKIGGDWAIFIRSSPEDMDEYPLEEGVEKVLKLVRRWRNLANSYIEGANDTNDDDTRRREEHLAAALDDRADEALEALRPLHDEGILDDLGVDYPWEWFD